MNKLLLILLVLCVGQVMCASAYKTSKSVTATVTWKELFDSFMEGAQFDDLVGNTTDCVHYVERGYDDLSEAVNHLVVRGFTWENYLDLMGALSDVTPIARTCYDVVGESYFSLSDHFARFNGFVDFITQVFDNMKLHFADWWNVYSRITDSLKRNRPKEVAFQIGTAVVLLFNFKPRAELTQIHTEVFIPNFDWAVDFLKGFLNGTRILSSDRIKRCINETDFVVDSITDANTEFRKGTDEGRRNGIFELTDIFAHLRPWQEQCVGGFQDLEKIILTYFNSFDTPMDIFYNAIRHSGQISISFVSALQNFKNSNWEKLGANIGDIFYDILVTN
jgi:hypothetical protein